ncbi:MAG: hypothetical protein ABNH38_05730 [Tateyamaria sp.]|jgi:hypothetical protein|uniref:hypothetical protein n=1 Tax=Tateyamaria sp. TaxID=1929288 RepID=UPI0032DC20A6
MEDIFKATAEILNRDLHDFAPTEIYNELNVEALQRAVLLAGTEAMLKEVKHQTARINSEFQARTKTNPDEHLWAKIS